MWQLSDRLKIAKLTYATIDPFILQAWVFLHTVMKSTNLKSRQQRFLRKLSNIMFANISAYTVCMCTCTHERICTHVHTHLHAHVHTYTHADTHMYTPHTHAHKHTHGQRYELELGGTQNLKTVW